MIIRPYRFEDRPQVERICVETGLRGSLEDYFCDPELFAKLWLSPYLDTEPEACWVADRDGEVVGYIVSSVRPGFKWRALRATLPHVVTLLKRWSSGAYRKHPASSQFVRWLLFKSWREVPKQPSELPNFHFNVVQDLRGDNWIGNGLMNAFFRRLREKGLPRFQIHVFGSAGRRDIGFYRKIDFRLHDVRPCSLFREATVVASLHRQVPEQDLEVLPSRRKNLPKISVVIPVHNDARCLSDLLEDLKSQALPADEIVIVCDNCTDDSPQVARSAGARVVEGVFRHPGIARNAGIAACRGDILVLFDADARVGSEYLAQVASAVDQGYDCGGPWLRSDEGTLHGRLWVAGQNVVRALTRCAYGTAYFATRSLFERAGSYDPTLKWGEDVELSLRHRLAGKSCRLGTHAVYSCRRMRENGRTRELGRRLWRAILNTPVVLRKLRSWTAKSMPAARV